MDERKSGASSVGRIVWKLLSESSTKFARRMLDKSNEPSDVRRDREASDVNCVSSKQRTRRDAPLIRDIGQVTGVRITFCTAYSSQHRYCCFGNSNQLIVFCYGHL